MIIRLLIVLVSFLVFAPAAEAQTPPLAAQCGELIPRTNGLPIPAPRPWLHYVPKHCATIPINGVAETIPAGVAVVSGGLQGDTLNACIDKVCGQVLAPSTVYRVYAYMLNGTMRMDFSTGRHIEHPVWGYHVHVSDETRSFIGLIFTNAASTLDGQSRTLAVSSWYNRGYTGFTQYVGSCCSQIAYAETCSPTLAIPTLYDAAGNVIPGDVRVEILVFEINDQFREGWSVPNISVEGVVKNTIVNKPVHVAVGVKNNWGAAMKTSPRGAHFQTHVDDTRSVHATMVGGGGTEEGLVQGFLLMSAPYGGCARMVEGQIKTSPHG